VSILSSDDRIRDLGERLDAHRKRQQALNPELTLTGIYNVLEKLRGGDHRSPQSNGDGSSPPLLLTDKEKKIHDNGLVTILKQIHDELDAAVLEAYGWEDLKGSAGVSPASEPEASGRDARAPFEQELLKRLVALNHERAAEEKRGLIRWLRPEYQAPEAVAPKPEQKEIDLGEDSSKSPITNNQSPITLSWPAALSAQVSAIQALLPATGPDAAALAGHFGKRSKARIQQIEEILKTLEGLGKL